MTDLNLYNWQKAALHKWCGKGGRGIVEAVTGTGKTVVGIAAIIEMATRHGFTHFHPLIVVPTQVLQAQWVERLKEYFPDINIGLIGQGHAAQYFNHGICVGIVNSVVRQLPELFKHIDRAPGKFRTLLVADECHHYIHAPVFNGLLRYNFDYTLGLSATIRPAVFDNHVKGLGDVVYSYEFADALRDKLIPPFDVVNCTCSFTASEHEKYFKLDEKVKEQLYLVRTHYNEQLRHVPPELFWLRLKQLMTHQDGTVDPVIKTLFSLLFRRASLSYQATHKLAMAAALTIQLVSMGKKVMVFLERINDADQVSLDASDVAADELQKRIEKTGVVKCGVYHSALSKQERHQVLEDFKTKGAKALVSCRSLDEGLDIGDVDCAILAASTQSPRQRIQRIGRILRRSDEKKRALVVTLYIPGTGDENVTADDEELFGQQIKIIPSSAKHVGGLIRRLINIGH